MSFQTTTPNTTILTESQPVTWTVQPASLDAPIETTAIVIRPPVSPQPETQDPGPGPFPGSNGVNLPYFGDLPFEIRDEVARVLLDRQGFRQLSTIVPRGESLLPIGEEKKARLIDGWNKLPTLETGLAALRIRRAQEKHIDKPVPIQRVRMSPDSGGLYGEGQDPSKALAYSPRGFSQVVDFVRQAPSTAGVLLTLTPAVRAAAFNDLASRATYSQPCRDCKGSKKVLKTYRDEQSRAMIYRGAACPACSGSGLAPAILRTILDPDTGRRIVRAVTSTLHSLENGSDLTIADAMLATLPKGAKLRITRDLDRTVFEVIWPMASREVRVGDLLFASVRVSHSETKEQGIEVDSQIGQILCYNLTIGYSTVAEDLSFRHVGDLRNKIPAALRAAISRVEPLIVAFGDAYKAPFPATMPTRGEVLTRTGKLFSLAPPTVKAIGDAWDVDGSMSAGHTLGGLANAMTRSAQDFGMTQAETLQRAAGQVVAQGWAAFE